MLSPEKRCGKTLLLRVLTSLVRSPWRVITPSEAVLYRKIQRDKPTLLLDETDAIFGSGKQGRDYEPLRAVLNAGNEPDTVVPRCGGANRDQLLEFSVYCPKVLAGIGNLPETVADRSISIRLERKAPHEVTERWRKRRIEPEADAIRSGLKQWGDGNVDALQALEPEVPNGLDDRAADGWEPLLAIAELAGDQWPERARHAALELRSTADTEEGDTPGVRLLADVRSVFEDGQVDRLATVELLDALAKIEEAPWRLWGSRRRDPGLNARDLAHLLKPYGIRSRSIWLAGGNSAKGYLRAQFEDAWSRYAPRPPVRCRQAVRFRITSGRAASEGR